MPHIVLLGDSIFDNKAYVGSEPDVITHLRRRLPAADWQATLKAVDGSVVENVDAQLSRIPDDATHLVVSVGGNNALMNADVLQLKAGSAAEVLNVLANRAGDFESQYSRMLANILRRALPTVVSTVYYPNFPEPLIQKIATTALTIFNDAILRQAILAGVPVLDLRLICNEASDYANPIEPSGKGGGKIAAKISEVAQTHDFSARKTCVYF
ncbi:MAG TPA: SGNH/GDSL hydrolase family protein [Pyrinomonadaceae bacterium]|nr:SGNH/GDSL hydrolase family protein [Pyrinomonadaceae bacterium]